MDPDTVPGPSIHITWTSLCSPSPTSRSCSCSCSRSRSSLVVVLVLALGLLLVLSRNGVAVALGGQIRRLGVGAAGRVGAVDVAGLPEPVGVLGPRGAGWGAGV